MCCGQCCKREFRPDLLLLTHDDPSLFLHPQYGGLHLWYVIYRWVAPVYYLFVIIYRAITYEHGSKIFIMLTYWCFFVLTFNCLMQAIVVTVHYVKHRPSSTADHQQVQQVQQDSHSLEPPKMPLILKFVWILQNVSYPAAPLISLMYWGFVVKSLKDWHFQLFNFTTHGTNLIYVLVDMCITGIPVRILHMYQPMVFGATYGAFTAIYWAAGGLNEHGEPFVYKLLDFGSTPTKAVILLLMLVFIVTPTMHMLFFGVYKLRVFVYELVANRKQPSREQSLENCSEQKL